MPAGPGLSDDIGIGLGGSRLRGPRSRLLLRTGSVGEVDET